MKRVKVYSYPNGMVLVVVKNPDEDSNKRYDLYFFRLTLENELVPCKWMIGNREQGFNCVFRSVSELHGASKTVVRSFKKQLKDYKEEPATVLH